MARAAVIELSEEEQHELLALLTFLNQLVRAYPRRPLHVVLDNSSTHSTPEVKAYNQSAPSRSSGPRPPKRS